MVWVTIKIGSGLRSALRPEARVQGTNAPLMPQYSRLDETNAPEPGEGVCKQRKSSVVCKIWAKNGPKNKVGIRPSKLDRGTETRLFQRQLLVFIKSHWSSMRRVQDRAPKQDARRTPLLHRARSCISNVTASRRRSIAAAKSEETPASWEEIDEI